MTALGFDYSAFGRGLRAGASATAETAPIGQKSAERSPTASVIEAYAPLQVE
jgi:hypothetical protein